MTIVVAGPGLMGSQIGCEFAINGYNVVFLVNRMAEAERRVDAAFALAATLDLWPAGDVASGRDRVTFAESVDELDPTTELFVESVAEDLAIKSALLKEAAARMPAAILASNTSSISITAIGEGGGAPERTLGMHYWNPPLLMPQVEVISGPETDPAHITRVVEIVRGIGKRPVVVDRDVPGFAWNRLQFALLREAAWIVENGVATPEVVDEIVREGLARRWRYTGPFATAALGGSANFARIANNLWPVISAETEIESFEPWLRHSPEELAKIKSARDQGLLDDLRRDRASTRSDDE
jgi:3-hydroxybutyryl-CoA dehydrogenase